MKDIEDRKKILGAWLGKAVGGTLGQPWEGCDEGVTLDLIFILPAQFVL